LLDAVDQLQPALRGPLLEAEAARARARLAAHNGEAGAAEEHYSRAIALFGELETPFYLARAQLEYSELLSNAGHGSAGELREQAEAVVRATRRPAVARASAAACRRGPGRDRDRVGAAQGAAARALAR